MELFGWLRKRRKTSCHVPHDMLSPEAASTNDMTTAKECIISSWRTSKLNQFKIDGYVITAPLTVLAQRPTHHAEGLRTVYRIRGAEFHLS